MLPEYPYLKFVPADLRKGESLSLRFRDVTCEGRALRCGFRLCLPRFAS
jgi:hypothetical protein